MKCLIPLLTLFLAFPVCADTLKIAVVDSGLNFNDLRFNKHLCQTGSKDFTGEGLSDTNGHGTAIVSLIEEYAGDSDYCIVILKYYSVTSPGQVNLMHEIEALTEATLIGANIVNLSGGGPDFNEEEYLVLKNNPNTTFVVAAGNDGLNIDVPGNEYFPASYRLKNQIVVGNVDEKNKKAPSSNYGTTGTAVEIGEDILAARIIGYGIIGGTSISTAIHTGKLIKERSNGTK